MGKGLPEITDYQYYQTLCIVLCLGPIKRVRRVWFDNSVVYDDRPEKTGWAGREQTSDGRRPKLASYLKNDNITVGLGTQTQTPDPAIEALVGTENADGQRGRARMVFKDLPLHKFGGRIPQMSFEVESADADDDGRVTVSSIVNAIFDMAGDTSLGIPGLPASARDFTALDDVLCDGFVMGERSAAADHLSPLQDAYMFDFAEMDDKLVAVKRGGDSIATIEADHMGMGTPDPQDVLYELTRAQQMESPQRVDVAYQSQAIDFQNFTQSTTREATLARKADVITLPVVMSESGAMAIARQTLAMKSYQRDGYRINLPWRYVSLCPTDIIMVPLEEGLQRMKITKQTIGLFGHIEFDVLPDDPDIYTLTGEGAAAPNVDGSVATNYAPLLWVGDLNALVNQPSASFDGISLITIVATARTAWGGATVRSPSGIKEIGVSEDASGYFWYLGPNQLITKNPTGGTIGYITASIPKWRGPNVWDTETEIYFQIASVYDAVGGPVAGNTGDGIIEVQDPPTIGGAYPGTYTVTMTSASNYTVRDPDDNIVGTGTVNSVFNNEIRIKLKSGGTAFVAGDEFEVQVTAAALVNGDPPIGSLDIDVLNGANVLYCDGEIIQYVSALDLGNGAYKLTRLLRGRRGTEDKAWYDHPSGSVAVLLTLDAAQRFRADLSEVGNTRTLNAFDNSDTAAGYDNTPAVSITLEGNVRKPWSPGALVATRDAGTDDVTLAWQYRSRWGDELRNGSGAVKLGEDAEKYDVEIWDSTFASLKRTISGLTSPSYVYTAAMQTTDFGAPTDPATPLGIKLFQVSALVGRGHPGYNVVAV